MIKLKDNYERFFGNLTEDTDKDIKKAEKIKKDLLKVGKFIETGFAMINHELSSFMAPGLRTWFTNAILKNMKQGKGFDRRGFEKDLLDWYEDR